MKLGDRRWFAVLAVCTALLTAGCDAGGVKACGALIGLKPCKKKPAEAVSQPPASNSGGAQQSPPPSPPATLATPDTVSTASLSTTVNVPVLFELNPDNPSEVVHTSWIMPLIGELQFVGRPYTAIYQPPPDYSGTATFSIQIERSDGSNERTNVTIRIDQRVMLHHPWACPASLGATGTVAAIAAHPAVADSLVALERDGLGLVSLRSTDGGQSWHQGGTLPLADVTSLSFDPDASALLHVSSAAESYVSPDGGLSWSVDAEPPTPAPVYPRYRIQDNQIWREDAADDEHMVTGYGGTLIALAADPGNPRRIYVLAADGLYVLFRDGTPGLDLWEGEQLVRIGDALSDPTGITVDSYGRIFLSGGSGVQCLEGDMPFEPSASALSLGLYRTADPPEAQVALDAQGEAAEVTLWLAETALLPGAPGVAAATARVVQEWIVPAGENPELRAPLPINAPGLYELAVVVRTREGIQARRQTTLVIEPGSRPSISQDLAVDGSAVAFAPDGVTYELSLANHGSNAEPEPTLLIAMMPGTDFELGEPLDPRWDCGVLPNQYAVRCALTEPLAADAGPVPLEVALSGSDAGVLEVTATGNGVDAYPADNVWSAAGSAPGNIFLDAYNLFSTPGPQGEMAIRVDVSNIGSGSALPVVSGLLTGFQLERDPGRWSVGAADADCTTPVNYCTEATCASALEAGARYTCRFRAPLLPGESAAISIGLTVGTDGGTLTHTAVAHEIWDDDGWDNLTHFAATFTPPTENTAPNPDSGGAEQCAGLLVLITFGACLDW